MSVALGVLGALLIVAQAWLLADVVAGAFADSERLGELRAPLLALLGVVLARAALAWGAELAAAPVLGSGQVRAARRAAGTRCRSGGWTAPASSAAASWRSSRCRGIDALDGYFSLYLPQLLLAVIVPVIVIAAVLAGDWISALIIAATIPLIPLFMALVGRRRATTWIASSARCGRLAGHFLDVVAGLPTLKVFGRAKAQAAAIREITDRYRTTAIATLRITFLSSLILELVATIAVALVAVAIGLRLLDGDMTLRAALFALVLAPEAYLPLRRLGANYHASAEGMAAAGRMFAVIDRPPPARGPRTSIPDLALAPIAVAGLRARYPDRDEPALQDLDAHGRAG